MGRHPNLLIGLLLAAVALLIILAVVGLGAPAKEVPNALVPLVTPVLGPTPTPTPPPVPASTPDAAEASPTTTEIAPGVLADCGRIPVAVCERAIDLARHGNEGDIVGTTLVVVDDTCPPATECDPALPFDAIVVFVTTGGDTTGWYAYHVVATETSDPEKAERWQDEIPPHIVDRIRAALATS
jgi:hypothetical protein